MKPYRIIKTLAAAIPLTIFTAFLFCGCAERHEISPTGVSSASPIITVSLDRSETPTADIKAIINVQGGRAGIAKVIYSISGNTRTTDTLYYSSGPMALTESIVLPNDIELAKDSSLTLQIIAIDEDGVISTFEHIFYPIDVQSPAISISYDNSHSYTPNDTVMVHITASDNMALYYIALSTAGAFAWKDTLRFNMPYPAAIDTVIPVPIPLTTYLNFEFWITVEAVDVNFNTSSISPDESIQIVFEDGPFLEVHPVGGSKWVSQGDSLRFWVVGCNNTPLKSLGYLLEYGLGEWLYTIQFRDSICGDFGTIDSVYFAYLVPDAGYCRNILYIRPFGYDYLGHYNITLNYFTVEDRIRFSQTTTFTCFFPDMYGQILVDDRRDLVYVGGHELGQIKVYSQTSQQFQNTIDLPFEFNRFCLSPDTNSILVIHPDERAVSVVDINASVPHFDTTVALSARPYNIETLADGTALITVCYDFSPCSILRMDLSDYSLDTLDLGPEFKIIAVSGNSEYALISSKMSSTSQLSLYQADNGIIATQTLNWGVCGITASHDGSRFFIFDIFDGLNAVIDNSLTILDSLPARSCHFSYERGLFSRNDRDLFLISGYYIGHVNAEAWTMEGYYTVWPIRDIVTIIGIATNATDDRMFIGAQMAPWNRFVFWDIPIDPR